MSATTWFIIAIVGFSLSGIALAAAVFMFIKMNIPAVIGDLTGKTVAREIRAMRDANASSGNKLHRSSSVNVNRGTLTEKVNDEAVTGAARAAAHASKRLDKTGSGTSARLKKGTAAVSSGKLPQESATEVLSTNVGEVDIEARRATEVLPEDGKTEVLPEAPGTAVLSEVRQTEVLPQTCQTEVLSETRQTEVLTEAEEQGGTTVLGEAEEAARPQITPVAFKITKSVIRIHTNEVIG